MSSNEESTLFAIYTLGYTFFSLVMIAPPTEFVAAGLTVQNMLASFLGSEELGFIYFHIKRTAATLLIHSCFPLGNHIQVLLFIHLSVQGRIQPFILRKKGGGVPNHIKTR